MRRLMFSTAVLAGCGVALFGAPTLAAAQSDQSASIESDSSSALADIVVTARRREENLQSLPVSITALSAEMLEARNIVALDKVANIAPGLRINQAPGAIGSASIYMRGIGFGDVSLGQDSPIGIYIDGVYNGRSNVALMQLVEPERIEVLRGPQGTLFGRNTTGGAISITTPTPSDDFGGMAKLFYGTFDHMGAQARIDSGLLGNSGLKLSVGAHHRQRDGTRDSSLTPNSRDPGAYRSDAGWFKVVGEWGGLQMALSGDYSEQDGYPENLQVVVASAALQKLLSLSSGLGGGDFVITPKAQYSIENDFVAREQRVRAKGLSLMLEYEISDAVSLKSISALRSYKRDDPVGYGPGNFKAMVGGNVSTFNGFYEILQRGQKQKQASQELQLLGNAGDFDYVAGLYYFREDGSYGASTRMPYPLGDGSTAADVRSSFFYDLNSRSMAAFAQVDWKPQSFHGKLEVSGGVRYTKDKRNFDQTLGVIRELNTKTDNTSFLGSVKYEWAPDFMTFARYSTGYRAGGVNTRATATQNALFRPEKMTSYELGFKLEAFDRRLRLNGSAYHNDYRDLQVAFFMPPTVTGDGGNVAVNANARYRGFELEAVLQVADGLTLEGSFGYVDPKYTRYPQALEASGAITPGCTLITLNGKSVGQNCASIAKFVNSSLRTAAAGVSYTLPEQSYGVWSVRADYSYRGASHYSVFNTASTPFQSQIHGKAYGLVSARAALSKIPLSNGLTGQFALYGDNLTDKAYNVQGVDFGFFGTVVYGEPRSFGIEARLDF